MTRLVDLAPANPSRGVVVLLPGRAYTPVMALLRLATDTALFAGWAVRQVWWEPPEGLGGADADAWVQAELDKALVGLDGPVRVLGKSLGTRALPRAVELGLPGYWLTPLLREPGQLDALRAATTEQILVGGASDDLWDGAAAAGLAAPVKVLEISGADHSLETGDLGQDHRNRDRVRRLILDWVHEPHP